MRIAVFHELSLGGARRAVNEIGIKLRKNNIVDLYLVDDKKDNNELKFFNNIYFYKFSPKIWKGKNFKVRLYKDSIELLKLFFLHKRIASDIKRKNYDLIFASASKYTQTPFILRFSNTYKVYYCHDPHYRILYEKLFNVSKKLDFFRFNYEKINRLLRKKVDKKNISGANLLIANSKFTKENVFKSYKRESIVGYLGVDVLFFKPEKIKKDIDILFIGSYEEVDGYFLLEDSLKLMNTKPKVKILAFENEWIADDIKLLDLYQRSKIVVCFAHNEPFGLVALEAMACGVPVVAVNEGGYKESVKNGKTGFLISRSPKIAVEKLEYLLNNNKQREAMGKNSREEALRNWTWEMSVLRIEKIIKEELKI